MILINLMTFQIDHSLEHSLLTIVQVKRFLQDVDIEFSMVTEVGKYGGTVFSVKNASVPQFEKIRDILSVLDFSDCDGGC